MSPTQRSLKLLRSEGYTAEVVEKFIPKICIRRDLYGFIDILAMQPGKGFLGVQACHISDVSKRRAKIRAEEKSVIFLLSGAKIEIHGWDKSKLKREEIYGKEKSVGK